MVIAIALAAIAQILTTIALTVVISTALKRKEQALRADLDAFIHDLVDARPDDKPSKLAEMLEVMGTVVGSAAARSLAAAIASTDSHVARQANTAADLIVAEQNPLMGLLAGGRRGKGAAVRRLVELVGPMLTKGANGGNGSSGPPPTQRSFSL